VSETRTDRKRKAILEAATTLFLRNGYRGTSMDEIAALAAVSKQTVYKQFADKERLFAEIVRGTVDEVADPIHDELPDLTSSHNLEHDLRDLARQQLASALQPKVLQLRRLVIGEAGRFPELGRAFYERGGGRSEASLAALFEKLTEHGVLRAHDPHLAATHFNLLVMAIPINRAMLLGDDELPTEADLDRHARDGVRAFLAAYRL
jgi:TetR/AcrR family transcriptional regulator, mexJK operon transcriptional repressor